jgi:hypothetical protein
MTTGTIAATPTATGWLDFTASIVHSVAWPLLILALALIFRPQILALLPKLREVSALGANLKFTELGKEVAADLVATPQSQAEVAPVLAQLPHPIHERIGRIVQTWNEIDVWLRSKISVGGLNPNPPISHVLNAGLQQGVLTPDQFKALRGLHAMRNLAVHGRASDIDQEREREFQTLAEAMKMVLEIPD